MYFFFKKAFPKFVNICYNVHVPMHIGKQKLNELACKMLVSHSTVVDDLCVLGCDTVVTVRLVPSDMESLSRRPESSNYNVKKSIYNAL